MVKTLFNIVKTELVVAVNNKMNFRQLGQSGNVAQGLWFKNLVLTFTDLSDENFCRLAAILFYWYMGY